MHIYLLSGFQFKLFYLLSFDKYLEIIHAKKCNCNLAKLISRVKYLHFDE